MYIKILLSRSVMIFTLLASSLGLFSLPSPAYADSDGNQISFNVKGGTFTRLRISGLNQNDDMAVWTIGDGTHTMIYAETTDWWWKGTVVIELTGKGTTANGSSWSGSRRCVIDYLKEPATTNTVPVTYTDGAGCSGNAGNASSPYRNEVEIFYKVFFGEEDSLRVLNAVSDASDSAQCLAAITSGLRINGTRSAVIKVIRVGWECNGVALNTLNNVLKKYNNKVTR